MTFHKFLEIVRTVSSYTIFGVLGIFSLIPCVVLTLILPQEKLLDNKLFFWFLNLFYRTVVWCLWVPVTITGKENFPTEPSIIVANHESALDIPFVGLVANTVPHVWFVLEYYVTKPVLGFFLRKVGISVDRDNTQKAARALIQGIRLVDGKNRHIIIFPEGARHVDGNVHEFFEGFALLAKKLQRPVVPVLLTNIGRVYPPETFLVHWYPITMAVGKPITYNSDDTEATFSERVHAWFKEQK